jgi:aldose 1-epimerase
MTVTTTARNAGDTALPYAAGQHPYLAASGAVDDVTLELPAATRIRTDERGLPTGRVDVAGTAYDFRTARPIGGAGARSASSR